GRNQRRALASRGARLSRRRAVSRDHLPAGPVTGWSGAGGPEHRAGVSRWPCDGGDRADSAAAPGRSGGPGEVRDDRRVIGRFVPRARPAVDVCAREVKAGGAAEPDVVDTQAAVPLIGARAIVPPRVMTTLGAALTKRVREAELTQPSEGRPLPR